MNALRLFSLPRFHRFPSFARTLLVGAVLGFATSMYATSYYVDSAGGNDSNSGTSASAPWQSLAKVNTKTYVAGDRIFFHAGSSWTGQLLLKGSGGSGNPIVVDMYGSGNQPKFNANGTKLNTVYFKNQSYWELNNLDVSNTGSGYDDRRGISVNGDDGQTINHFYIRNCTVHNVTGEVKWIGGSTSGNTTGVTFQAGWDASKRTGGIVFDIQNTAVKTNFNDLLVENCTITACSFAGISVKNIGSQGQRSSTTDTNWFPHTNVVLRGNTISNYNTTLGCNGIYLTDTKGATIEHNVIKGCGTCGIENYFCDSVTIQYNEVYDTVKKANGADFNGIDPDKGTTNIVVQYNYSHNNGDGILVCQFSFGSATIRYNILQNNSRYGIYLHSDSHSPASLYNNVVFTNNPSAKLVFAASGNISAAYSFRNNIFYSSVSGPSVITGGGITYDYNCYFGCSAPSDAHRITSNPLFVSPGSGANGIGTVNGYKLQSSSPCINRGLTISSNGGRDFFGTTLYNGAADVGADEF